jgi:hypothetical protein
LDCGVIDHIRDFHTPTGLVDHHYIWQSKQQEVEEIDSKGPAIADTTTHTLTHYKDTTHNVQPKFEGIYKQSFGTLVQGNINYLIFKKLLVSK